jgi:hypothetical protein
VNEANSPTDNSGDDLLRVKQKLSTSMKKRSKLMQSDTTPADEPAPAPEPEPAPAASPASEQPLRNKRLKRSGHFELKPNPFAPQEDAPPEDTEY